ncbi:hypothetical protein N7450_011543 [Penicillium hetheringtonii]|uniref:Uncharacterized protein n=1 Tax=Penicillium hetheringtonii TaxID=911720 RepID=A0AAD6DBU2_9EURO|nr:hypothetical protein N7450_011543 [Penicillium hetheringtonii]
MSASPSAQPVLLLPRVYTEENITPTPCVSHKLVNADEGRYLKMLREDDQMDLSLNITASVANWALLAGYLVIPGTFASLQSSNQVGHVLNANKTGRIVLHAIQNPPLLVIACLFLAGGIGAMLRLLHFPKLRGNYVWLTNRIFIPVTLNAGAGLLTTLVNVFTSHGGTWSIMAIVTRAVTGTTFLIFLVLLLVYKFYKVPRLNGQSTLRSPVFIMQTRKRFHH